MVGLFFRGHLNQHLSIGPPILWVRNLGKKQRAKLVVGGGGAGLEDPRWFTHMPVGRLEAGLG